MSDQMPTLIPPSGSSSAASGGGDAAPSFTPSTLAVAAAGGITAWNNDKRVSALWGISQNRNSWVHVPGVGWKKLANNSDSAVMALTILAAHTKQTQTNYSYRDESDGMIHETYVWQLERMAECFAGERHNGGAVSAATGDVVVICLPENPSTGYRWQIETAAGLTLIGDEFSPSSVAPGSGGERRLRFATPAPGNFHVQATLSRAWESGVAPQARFQVTIQVK